MKQFWALLIFFLIFSCKNAESDSASQTKVYDGNKYVVFNLKHTKDTTTFDGIDWEKEKLFSEFTLKGKNDIRYSIRIKNDSIGELLRYENGKWFFQEEMQITGFALSRIQNSAIISEFQITDFNKDGNEDLLCWVDTSAHGNKWTLIYLNNPNKSKLSKLLNKADNSDIWDVPIYNAKTKIINCISEGSAYGATTVSSFRLDHLNAIPVTKYIEDRNNPKYVVNLEYIGRHGKWELVSKTRE